MSKNIKQLQKAFLSAFPTPSELAQMVYYAININIHEIAKDDNLTVKTYELIMWAISKNKIKELITGAKKENSGNLLLKEIKESDYEFTEKEIAETKHHAKQNTQIANKIYNINKIEGGAKFD